MIDLTIEEFLLARLKEVETLGKSISSWYDRAPIQTLCDNQRAIIEWHKNWPVLAETPPVFSQELDGDRVHFKMAQKVAWLTQEEYRKRFGSEPPTAPLLAKMATAYKDHPDFNPEWETA